MSGLDGHVALVTGASRGIGREAALALVDAGASVGVLARSQDDLDDLVEEIGDDRALALPCDVATWTQVQGAVGHCVDRFGRLDLLVNNAGLVQPIANMVDADPAAWRHTIDVNLMGVFHGIRAAAPVMIEQGSGTVITISSGAAHRPLEGWSAYSTSKAGAAMLTQAADLELRDQGIRVMGLSPGTVATDMQREIKHSGVNRVSQLDWDDHIPPSWVARTLVWMAGPAGDDLHGTEVSLRDDDVRRAVGLEG